MEPLLPSHTMKTASNSALVAVLAGATGLVLLSHPLLHAASIDPADQWHQWRGPEATGVAPKANPPTQWSETKNVKWKAALPGEGAGTPIVWDKHIFIQVAIPTGKKIDPPAAPAPSPAPGATAPAEPKSAFQFPTTVPSTVFGQVTPPPPLGTPGQGQPPGPGPDGQRRRRPGGGGPGGPGGGRAEKPTEFHQFALLALERNTGKVVWQKNLREEVPHEGHHRDHTFASHSPITDGTHIYGWFGSRGLYCLDFEGNVRWQKQFGAMRTLNGFGEGGSIALSGDTLVINWDHEGEDFITALDKNSGKELWRNTRDEKTTWTTPLVIDVEGRKQVVVSATQRIRSYDLDTGKQVWECGGMTANVIPTPVIGFGHLYAISGFRGNSLLAIKLGKTGDLTDTDAISWRHTKNTPYVPSPLLLGNRLYFLSGNNSMLSVLDAEKGTPLIDAVRLEGPSGFYASPVAAQDRVYLAGRNGTSLVLKKSDQLEILASNVLEEQFDASPAIAGRELYLRGHKHLYCIAEP